MQAALQLPRLIRFVVVDLHVWSTICVQLGMTNGSGCGRVALFHNGDYYPENF